MDRKRKPIPSSPGSSSDQRSQTTAGPSNASATAPAPQQPIATGDVATESHNDLPPSYTGPSVLSPPGPSRTLTSTTAAFPLALPPVDFKAYRMAGVSLSKDKMTYVTNMPHYSQSPQALSDLIQAHAKLPPHPQIRITANRLEGGLPYFDIKISMMRYLVRPPDARGSTGWQYVRTIGDGELGWRGGKQAGVQPVVKNGLDDWITRFVMEEVKDKSFTLTKHVTNWNTAYLEGQIRGLVASTGFKGGLTISFPVTHSSLVVQGPKESRAWYEAFADVFKPRNSRRYEVVSAVWPYAALAADDANGQGNAYAVKSEMQVWNEWKDVLKAAILDQHRGWLTMEDHMEWSMGNGWDGKKQTGNWNDARAH